MRRWLISVVRPECAKAGGTSDRIDMLHPNTFIKRGSIRRPLSESLRVQSLLVLLSSLVMPSIVIQILFEENPFQTTLVQLSLFACLIANLTFVFFRRQLADLPGRSSSEDILPLLVLSFSAVVVFFIIFRMEYSRVVLITAFAAAFIGQLFVLSRTRRTIIGPFFVIPFGNTERLHHIDNITLIELDRPVVPKDTGLGIIADLRARIPDEWERMIAHAVLARVPVFHIKQVEEALTGRVDIEHLSENTFGSLSPDQIALQLKRLGDIVATLIAIPIVLPIIAIVALLVKIDSDGPVFFRQDRVGQMGKIFRIYKFRTMMISEASEDSAWFHDHSIKRITDIGKYLRRYRLDELPQIINIMRGEMSWIGPRPESVSLSKLYDNNLPFYSYRHILKPGLTGWAQVLQGHVDDLHSVHEKLRFDFYYIKNFSIWLDFAILARTVRVVLTGFGSK